MSVRRETSDYGYTRREFFGWLLSHFVAGGAGYVISKIQDSNEFLSYIKISLTNEALLRMLAARESEHHERLRNAGLEEFLDFYNTQRKFIERFGVALFPEVTQVIFKVANAELSPDAQEVKALSRDWPKKRNSGDLESEAFDIA